MKDFFKIFLSLCVLVTAFVVGKGYGEKTFLESDEYKKIAQTRDELDFTKNEIENAKAKLQNIVDAADKEKTDELFGKLFDVFLTDLGLRIQNKELILKNAQLAARIPKHYHREIACILIASSLSFTTTLYESAPINWNDRVNPKM